MNKIIRVIDLEIGSERDAVSPGICQYGHVDVTSRQADMLGAPYEWSVFGASYGTLVNPKKPIEPQYSAIHNIIDEDVTDAPEWFEVAPRVSEIVVPNTEIVAYAAHNIKMESNLIHERITGYKPWICTYKVALKLWPESASHSNNAVRYHLKPDGLIRSMALPVHHALPDAYITAFTLREALNLGHSVETLIKWTNEPSMLPRCKIGDKHRTPDGRGVPWREVETSFMEWILSKEFDEDTKHTCRTILHERAEQNRIDRQQADLNRQFVANGMAPAAISRPGELANDETEQKGLPL